MKKAKALIAIILAIMLLLPFQLNLTAQSFQYIAQAYRLHALGLYEGTSATYFNPDLGSTVERQVAVILLLKMFGKKSEVEAMTKAEVDSILASYTDQNQLAPWCRPYMAYGVRSGMVAGTSKTTLGPKVLINGVSFAVLVLKNMGYTFTPETFVKSLQILSDKGGITAWQASYFNKPVLIKDDIIGIIYGAMRAVNPSGQTLAQMLVDRNVVSQELAIANDILDGDIASSQTSPSYSSNKLSETEIAYLMIKEALLTAAPSIMLPYSPATDTAQEVFDLVEKVTRENPGVLYHKSSTYHSNGLLELFYSKNNEVARTHYKELEQKADNIIQSILTYDMTEYEKELVIHDYIVNHCQYDLASFTNGTIAPESYSAYGALVKGKAVCEGYAEAFKLLLDKAKIASTIVVGTSQGSGHAWNIVTIAGDTYQVDITWDDPVMEDGEAVLSHAYFNLTDKEIAVDHIWIRADYPVCTSSEYNYYVYNNLVVDTAGFVNFAVNQAKSGQSEITVKISNFSPGFDLKAAVTQICKQLKRGASYMVTEEFGIVDLTIN